MHPHPLWICRHGETVWNRAGRWQGDLDSPLTERGESQARTIGGILAAEGIGPATHRILTSPQGRSRRTANLALPPGMVARPDPRLREIGVGRWAGQTRDAIRAEVGALAEEGLFQTYALAPGGEGFEALSTRLCDLLAALDGPAVIFTHGITSRVLRAVALGLDWPAGQDLPGGQGVVHRLSGGRHETLDGRSVYRWAP